MTTLRIREGHMLAVPSVTGTNGTLWAVQGPVSTRMTTLGLISTVTTAAAIFGSISVRICRLPVTIGTMLLTVISSLILIILSPAFPSLHAGAMNVAGRIKFEDFILHGI